MKEKSEKKRKKGKTFYVLFVTAVLCVYSCAVYFQYKQRLELYKRESELDKEIKLQEKIYKELTEQSEYSESDEYIEKIARQQLGLVKPNEILFIDQNAGA